MKAASTPIASAEQPVTRAELADILREAGFVTASFGERPSDPMIHEFNSVFADSPAYRRLLEQVGQSDAKSALTSVP